MSQGDKDTTIWLPALNCLLVNAVLVNDCKASCSASDRLLLEKSNITVNGHFFVDAAVQVVLAIAVHRRQMHHDRDSNDQTAKSRQSRQ